MRFAPQILTVAIATALAGTALDPSACAQSDAGSATAAPVNSDAQSTAQREFEAGVTAFDGGHHDEALVHFRASLEAFPSPNTRLYVARTLSSLGRVGEAAVEYDRTAREATTLAEHAPRYAATADAARAEARALERRIGRIALSAQGLPSNARIRIGDSTLTLDEASHPVPVTPGQVRIRIEADGLAPTEQDVQVTAGQTLAVIPMGLVRGESASGNDVSASTASAPSASHGQSGGLNLPAVSLAGWGVGVVGFAAFGVFAYLADDQYRSLPSRCGQMPCPASQTGAIDTGRAYETATNVSLAVGLVGLAVGTAWFVWDRTRARPAPRVGVHVVGPMLLVGGTF